jgi:hypothetical protein
MDDQAAHQGATKRVGAAEQMPRPWRKPLARLGPRHQLAAQLLAQGRQVNEVGRQAGFTPTYISHFRSDPLFQECLALYARERDSVYAAAVRRQAEVALGVDALSQQLPRYRARQGRPRGRPFGAVREQHPGPAAVLAGGTLAPPAASPMAPETAVPGKSGAAPEDKVTQLTALLAEKEAQLARLLVDQAKAGQGARGLKVQDEAGTSGRRSWYRR